MSKKNRWKPWILAGSCFIMVGIFNILDDKRHFVGFIYILVGGLYFFVSRQNYKQKDKMAISELPPGKKEELDRELAELISVGKKIEAIRRYRISTGAELKEAKEYIDRMAGSSRDELV